MDRKILTKFPIYPFPSYLVFSILARVSSIDMQPHTFDLWAAQWDEQSCEHDFYPVQSKEYILSIQFY